MGADKTSLCGVACRTVRSEAGVPDDAEAGVPHDAIVTIALITAMVIGILL